MWLKIQSPADAKRLTFALLEQKRTLLSQRREFLESSRILKDPKIIDNVHTLEREIATMDLYAVQITKLYKIEEQNGQV